ncbi:riboflavin synthase [Pseudoalteromonas carrageenovora]|uniref:riboflavin synthase n=1 Tax=Pseudoalteromonas TaxID=53246 RepID=UPI00073214C9|nr:MULTISPECIES: riboflavin synthase [Pseudoalteromonas]KTF10551.1 riboflavin synthase subunit alpha [Pseudoalteromonas sp. H103]MBQ4799056.1 riboflavin synthase [Pseudoalteromonas sp. MMG006]MBQ4858285.1 riboflavin synthase [Pseudoalteromonas sp. MMG007]MCQ8888050.1 riboflavin synthase [Pseudoalteromonas carrageenovora]MDO6546895.1 riboflavin synthase [Pseudoalteromonas carrageenovora]
MFTGIVQTQATVVSKVLNEGVIRLVVSVGDEYVKHLDLGASIAINGCCLTVVKVELSNHDVVAQVHFDVIDETLALTNLGELELGSLVNYERSVTFGTELGGHIVSGHIHCAAQISQIIKVQSNCKIQLSLPKKWQKYVIYKGFVAINGASLTVGEVDEHGFWLHLIPETLAITNLGSAQVGDKLNIEVDQQTYTIINTVENYLRHQG